MIVASVQHVTAIDLLFLVVLPLFATVAMVGGVVFILRRISEPEDTQAPSFNGNNGEPVPDRERPVRPSAIPWWILMLEGFASVSPYAVPWTYHHDFPTDDPETRSED